MSRVYARECVFKLVFSFLFVKEKDEAMLDEFLSSKEAADEKGYISEVYNGVINHFDELMEEIKQHSKMFKIDRIYRVDLAILLVAIYEIKNSIAPKKVCVNEALNLSKVYSTEKSSNYINGILSNYMGE